MLSTYSFFFICLYSMPQHNNSMPYAMIKLEKNMFKYTLSTIVTIKYHLYKKQIKKNRVFNNGKQTKYEKNWHRVLRCGCFVCMYWCEHSCLCTLCVCEASVFCILTFVLHWRNWFFFGVCFVNILLV